MPHERAPAVLAFDYGLRRIGVAVGNVITSTAEPLVTLRAECGDPDWTVVERCIADWHPGVLLVGIPYNMDGTPGSLTDSARSFAAALAERTGCEVVTLDERLSSHEAEETLRRRRRDGTLGRRIRREDVDREAACVLLRQWLNARPA